MLASEVLLTILIQVNVRGPRFAGRSRAVKREVIFTLMLHHCAGCMALTRW